MKACFAHLGHHGQGAHGALEPAGAKGRAACRRAARRVHFERTPLLSTYLLALAVGALEASAVTRCGRRPRSGCGTCPARATSRASPSRPRARRSRASKRYFDLPYPYEKLDLVAVPDFEAGAMENAGAVFFRETLLLVDPETATLPEKKRVAEVICHELAHMWYGDLVTMAWWDDLWLNEAFATWMAFHVVDAWKPEWKMWNDFQHYRSAALGHRRAREHPPDLHRRCVRRSEATENFDLITYEKGASVVRMIERYLGAETFRAGVRRYIREHQRGQHRGRRPLARAVARRRASTSSRSCAPGSSRPASRCCGCGAAPARARPCSATTRSASASMRSAARRAALADPLGRARGHRRTPPPHRAAPADGEPREHPARAEAAAVVYGNADEGGFFRPLHDDAELEALAGSLDTLSPVERMGLVGHQWAVTRAGRAKLDTFLDLGLAMGAERDPDVLLTLRAPLAQSRPHGEGAPGRRGRGRRARPHRGELRLCVPQPRLRAGGQGERRDPSAPRRPALAGGDARQGRGHLRGGGHALPRVSRRPPLPRPQPGRHRGGSGCAARRRRAVRAHAARVGEGAHSAGAAPLPDGTGRLPRTRAREPGACAAARRAHQAPRTWPSC